jgi:hypothetical protein
MPNPFSYLQTKMYRYMKKEPSYSYYYTTKREWVRSRGQIMYSIKERMKAIGNGYYYFLAK